MEDYKPNSHRFKEEEKKEVKKVVTGKAKTKKRSRINALAENFVSEDAHDIGNFIVFDVIFPAAKKIIYDVVTEGINMILYGGSERTGKKPGVSNISYRKFYDDGQNSRRYEERSRVKRFDYDDIVFDTRGEAEDALEQMENIIERYEFVTVADIYDMADLQQPYTSAKYGWDNVSTAVIVRAKGGGYIIKLPKARPID